MLCLIIFSPEWRTNNPATPCQCWSMSILNSVNTHVEVLQWHIWEISLMYTFTYCLVLGGYLFHIIHDTPSVLHFRVLIAKQKQTWAPCWKSLSSLNHPSHCFTCILALEGCVINGLPLALWMNKQSTSTISFIAGK